MILLMWTLKKHNKLISITKNKQTNKKSRLTDTENKEVVTSGEREVGRGKTEPGD